MPCFPCFKRAGKEKYSLNTDNTVTTQTQVPPEKCRTPSPEKNAPVEENIQKSDAVKVESAAPLEKHPETKSEICQARQEFFQTSPDLSQTRDPFQEKKDAAAKAKREAAQAKAEAEQAEAAKVKSEAAQAEPEVVQAKPEVLQKQEHCQAKESRGPTSFDLEGSEDLDDKAAFELALTTLAQLYELRPEDLTPEMASDMEKLVARLEKVADRLESAASRGGGGPGGDDDTAEFVTAFETDIQQNLVKIVVKPWPAMGDNLKKMCNLLEEAFKSQRDLLVTASKSRHPPPDVFQNVLKPLSEKIMQIQEVCDHNRRDKQFNHMKMISEGIPALGWVTVAPKPVPYIHDTVDSAVFYSNRVLKDFKGVDPAQVEFAKSFINLLRGLEQYVKDFHTTGLTWNPKGSQTPVMGASSGGAAPPPPPPVGAPAPPPPPPVMPPTNAPAGGSAGGGSDSAKAALFADLNKGTDVTRGLKKVTDDMKTHKNPALRVGPTPFKPAPAAKPKPAQVKAVKTEVKKPPKLELEGKKWIVEYQENNPNLSISDVVIKQTVYIYKCNNSTIKINGKVNSITMDNCKKVALVVDGVLSSVDFVNCQRMQMQALGPCPTVSIDKTDGCQVYLSEQCLDVEIVTAKSSEMNIMVPKGDGDFDEFPLPEQFKSKWNKKGFTTESTESV